MELTIGQKAPTFSLPNHLKNHSCLEDYLGQMVVLAFFPLAWTPI